MLGGKAIGVKLESKKSKSLAGFLDTVIVIINL